MDNDDDDDDDDDKNNTVSKREEQWDEPKGNCSSPLVSTEPLKGNPATPLNISAESGLTWD